MNKNFYYVKTINATKKGVKRMLDRICLLLVIIGSLNWGSVGLFRFDLVAFACGGSGSMISRVVYTLVGLSAVWCVSLLFRDRVSAEEHT